jgi:maleate isomerase
MRTIEGEGDDLSGPVLNYGSRGAIGLLLPSGNQAAEAQLRAMLPADVGLRTTRLKLTDSSHSSLLAMADRLEDDARLLADARVSLVFFHCTAVSTFSAEMEASLESRITSATGLPSATTSRALVEGLKVLGSRRLTLLSPYGEAVNAREAAFFESNGFSVESCDGFGCHTADEMMAITPAQWLDFAVRRTPPHADVCVLSCTTVRTAEIVQALERRLGRPVITSNTAAAWYAMRRLGVLDSVVRFGELLERR